MIVFMMVVMAVLLGMLIASLKKISDMSRAFKEADERSEDQLNMLERELREARAGRHDLKNHLETLKGLTEQGESEQATEYLEQMLESNTRKSTISSGNAVADSILRAKIEVMEENGVSLKLRSTLPRRLNIQPSYLTAILANLLDNAISAASASESGYVDLSMSHTKGNLVLMIKNPFVGEIQKENDKFITGKSDKKEHGFGLSTVQNTVKRLGGSCDIDYANNIFSVFVMLPA